MQLPSGTTSANTADTAAKNRLSVTWLGHSTFLLRSPTGVRLLFDPWLRTNPACPEKSKRVDGLELILVTHGHSDHCGDVVSVGRTTGVTIVAVYELAGWLERQGLRNLKPMNIMKDWGRSDDDQRHRLVLYGSVNTSMATASTPWERFSHGFQLSSMLQAYSALPYNITSGVTTVQGTAGRPIVDGVFILRNTGVGTAFFSMSLRLSRSFKLAIKDAAEGHDRGL